ncbi:MAG: hypothetical protein AB8I08_23125 [Sandaracinaceae bacterium]
MHLCEMGPEERALALSAMATVVLADERTEPEESELLRAAAIHLELDDAVPQPLAPGALSGCATRVGERVVQAAILAAMIDGRVDPVEVEAVRRLAEEAGVHEPRIHNLAQLSRGHLRRLWLDLARRSFAREVFVKAAQRDGLRGVWQIVGPMLGRAGDPVLASRYIALGELELGTLGRAYFDFILAHDLGFPGEGVVAEAGVWHDVAHVLGGYGTRSEEEVEVVSFIAGFSRQDPFFWLFTIALQFHMGVRVSPYSPRERGFFVPSRVFAAFARGAAMKVDLSAPSFEPWDHFSRPLAEVRDAFGVSRHPTDGAPPVD